MKNKSLILEIIIATCVGGILLSYLVAIDTFEWVVNYTREHEEWELDEIILAVWVALVFGLIVAIHRLLMDISERKQNTLELKEAMRKTEELSQMKSNFLSMVSHELRTPLTSIIGFAKLSRKHLDDIAECKGEREDVAKILRRTRDNTNVIISEGDRLAELINNVLDLAKLESGHFKWHFHPVAMEEILQQSIDSTSILFVEKKLTLKTDIASDLPTITGDFDRLVQVCVNLLANAAKFTQEGHVACRAGVEKGNLTVRIEDTGVGVPKKDQGAIFDKFKQLGDTLTDKPKGTGLGLPISKEIVEHHNGKIWCERNQYGGSTFVFSIPVAGPEASETHK